MDRIFLLGNNLQLALSANAGIPLSQIETQNQPAIVVKDWDTLTLAQQTAIINFLAPFQLQAAN